MPVDWGRYPEDWKAIALGVKEEAGWKCQKCGIGHMEDGSMGSCLTVHHPDKDTMNPEAVMEALCARCHLAADAEMRRDERRIKRSAHEVTV